MREGDSEYAGPTRSMSVTDFRNSINQIRNSLNSLATEEELNQANNEKRWRLSYLKEQFEALQLHNLFNRYTERIAHGYFSQFLSLQIILVTSHLIILLALEYSYLHKIVADLILYALVASLSILILVLTDSYVRRCPKLLRPFAVTIFVAVFFTNAFIPFYYKADATITSTFRPAYTTHLIISCYVFLNFSNYVAITMGVFVSVFHVVILVIVTYEAYSSMFWERIVSDAIYLTCVNGLGIYFRYMNEIVKRRSFLDRRSCVESTFQLKFEEEQANQLMSSIIPKHIIDRVRRDIMKFWDDIEAMNEIPRHRPFKDPYVEVHDNVTILFADIVNYTEMTSSLGINDLLETLNELFGRFDDASEILKVLRIKFLGDCYYCVAGLPPDPAPNHAEACVDLGLKMISIISDVRRRRQVNIDMRIGIHTGRIISGIIGSIKWQYDVWSNDVDIANKMETQGCPGKVHVTHKTKSLLQKSYDIISSGKSMNNESTYLISPPEPDFDEPDIGSSRVQYTRETSVLSNGENQRRPTIYKKRSPLEVSRLSNGNGSILSNLRSSNGSVLSNSAIVGDGDGDQRRDTIYSKRNPFLNPMERRYSGNPALGGSLHRRLSMNGNRILPSERRITPGDGKRRTAFMNNNIKRYEERLAETNKELEDTIENMLVSKYEQWFKGTDLNPLFLFFKNWKHELHFIATPDPLFKYYVLSQVALVVFVFIIENLTQPQWDWTAWPFYVTLGIIIFFFLPLTWTHHLWTRHVSKYDTDSPRNFILKFFYDKSKFVTSNVLARIAIYTVICIMFCICVFMQVVECQYSEPDGKIKDGNFKAISFMRVILRQPSYNCNIPWHMTETTALAIIMTFIFLRIYIWIKFIYAIIITAVYCTLIWNFNEGFYTNGETFNYLLQPQVSHVISVVFLTITLHLVDRQTEYMNRLDHLWYETLVEKEKQASSVHVINTMLLKNILPIHVAEIYLDVGRRSSEGLYHENYDLAAVMFASIVDIDIESIGDIFLNVMNSIICDFDMLSVGNNFGRPIEKIKQAKWTYLVACGLVPGLGNTENIRRDQTTHAVISLIKFASCLMKKLKEINNENMQEMKLRIGISYGAIAAGVVGSKKPLYDIWGDPVNMASRMDTTGLPNHIQVLEATADIIQQFGYVCHYRGKIAVKGRKYPEPTYFVALDENFDLIKRRSDD